MFDVNLLRIMKYRKEFTKIYSHFPQNVLEDDTRSLLKDFKRYFDTYKEHDVIDLQEFIPRMKQWHPSMLEERLTTRINVLKQVRKDVDDDTYNSVTQEIYKQALATTAQNVLEDYMEGEVGDLAFELSGALETYKKQANVKLDAFIDTDIGEILEQENDEGGYEWRLACLRNAMRGLRAGDFGIVAARPDKGKTSFLASEITYLAKQIPAGKNIVWLNNEGPGERIIPRLYQAALGVPRSELLQYHADGTLRDRYCEAIGGDMHRIRVKDIHGLHVGQVEGIIEQNNAEIVIYDMIDNIKGFGNEARTDLALERMYQWARECAVKLKHAGIATSQISNDGDGEMFPTLGMLKDSKTGKQGACDFQLMIGATNAPEMALYRYIGLPKNKLRREGRPGDPRAEVLFRPEIARYYDASDLPNDGE